VANETELAVALLLGVLGALGGIPQLLQQIKPKPRLKITEAQITKLPEDNYKYQVHLMVQNETKFWRRNADATNVTADYYVIDKNDVQCAAAKGQMLAEYLCAGIKIQKDTEAYHSLTPEGNPYSVIFMVTCAEGGTAKKRIPYEAAPIIYS
jgi:hypothetical protein